LDFIFFLCNLLVVAPTISIFKRAIVELKTLLIFLITIEVYPFNHVDTSNGFFFFFLGGKISIFFKKKNLETFGKTFFLKKKFQTILFI